MEETAPHRSKSTILERQGGSLGGLGWVLLPTKMGQVLLSTLLLSWTKMRRFLRFSLHFPILVSASFWGWTKWSPESLPTWTIPGFCSYLGGKRKELAPLCVNPWGDALPIPVPSASWGFSEFLYWWHICQQLNDIFFLCWQKYQSMSLTKDLLGFPPLTILTSCLKGS